MEPEGRTLIVPIDIDEKDPAKAALAFLRARSYLSRLGVEISRYEITPSRKGYHVYIEVRDPIPISESIRARAYAGDDMLHIFYDLMKLYFGLHTTYGVLFTEKRKLKKPRIDI